MRPAHVVDSDHAGKGTACRIVDRSHLIKIAIAGKHLSTGNRFERVNPDGVRRVCDVVNIDPIVVLVENEILLVGRFYIGWFPGVVATFTANVPKGNGA